MTHLKLIEGVTKGHIATYTLFLLNLKRLCSLVSLCYNCFNQHYINNNMSKELLPCSSLLSYIVAWVTSYLVLAGQGKKMDHHENFLKVDAASQGNSNNLTLP